MNFITLLLLSISAFKTYPVRYAISSGWDLVSVGEVARTFGLDYTPSSRGISLSDRYGNTIAVDTVNSKIIVRGQKIDLPLIIKKRSGRNTLVPADLWAQALRTLWKSRNRYIYWDVLNHNFFEIPYSPSIHRFWITHKFDTLIVKLNYDKGLLPKIFVTKDTVKIWVKSGFYGGACWITGDGRLYQFARVKHAKTGVAFKFRFFFKKIGYKFQVTSDTSSVFKFFKGSTKKTSVKPAAVRQKNIKPIRRRIETIVVDAGHGGKDPGAIGAHGTKEKDIALAIAKKLKKVLEKRGFKVILTRSSDRCLTLEERTEIANNADADLFISIHCNWNRKSIVGGTEVYFLSTAKTTWERAVAMRENASFVRYNGKGKRLNPLDAVLLDMAQAEFLQESEDLAGFIQHGIVSRTGLLNRGVKQAGFYVLYKVFMPAVLVETAFISNPAEERKLKNSEFQWRIARGIADGIVKFKKSYER